MIDISTFKRRNSSASKLVFRRSSMHTSMRPVIMEGREKQEFPEDIMTDAENIPPISIKEDPNELILRVNWLKQMLSQSKNLAKKVENQSVSSFEEIQRKLIEIQDLKNKLTSDIAENSQKFEASHQAINSKIQETEKRIEKLKALKEKSMENSHFSKNKLKFYRDLTNLEILNVDANSQTMVLEAKHELIFIRFQLVETYNTFEYHLIETNIPSYLLNDAFSNDIVFEKDQFKVFYIEMMELLYSIE